MFLAQRLWQIIFPAVALAYRQAGFCESIFFGSWRILVYDRLVIGKRRHADRKPLPPLTRGFHVRDDFCFESFVVFFGILFVEDAVFGSSQTLTPENIVGVIAMLGVGGVAGIKTCVTKHQIISIAGETLIQCFDINTKRCVVGIIERANRISKF